MMMMTVVTAMMVVMILMTIEDWKTTRDAGDGLYARRYDTDDDND